VGGVEEGSDGAKKLEEKGEADGSKNRGAAAVPATTATGASDSGVQEKKSGPCGLPSKCEIL